ncbi:ATP-binding protein [Siculibacillus lacustris]|uniref:ATP-binding protein n=1 Tax=Siculibacillus lacustris TaxID=1549641 RepID=UPI0013F1743F|nr:ATP-binding protein [Siculibacillus lacustris]
MSLLPPSSRLADSLRVHLRAAFGLSTLLGLMLIACVWAGTHFYLRLDREKSLEAAMANSANIARVFEEHVAQSVKEIDKTLLFLRHAWEADRVGFDLSAWTNNAYLLRDLTVQVALIGPDGRLVATNLTRAPERVDLSDRPHFRAHLGPDRDELYISAPVLGRVSGRWTVQLTRRLSNPDGSFGGVIVASLDPYRLSDFFEQIDLGHEGAITLFGTDGVIRARGGIGTDLIGRSIVGKPLFEAFSRETSGSYLGDGTVSAGRRLVSFRRMKDLPLVVTVGLAEQEFLADYLAIRRNFLGAAAIATLLLLLVIGSGIEHEVRLIRARIAQRASEADVADKTQELEATLAHMSQGIVMIDPDERLRVVNRRAREFLRLPAGGGVRLPEAARAQICGLQGRGAAAEFVLDDGTVIEHLATRLPDGATLHTLTDVTARKRHEAILAEARDRAESASRARTAFLATMSHEIRTPLNGVIGMSRLIEDCDDPAERSAHLDTMRHSAEHLLQIIDDILDVSKLEADRMAFEAIPFEVAEIVRASVEIVAPRAREKGIGLSAEMAPNVPPRVVGDPGRLRQILLNLIGNAVKFTESGGVSVTVEGAPVAGAAETFELRISVADTGIGMAESDLCNLFQEFSQLDGSISRRFGGTGLGLAISRKLLEKMGGRVEVASLQGRGSIFTVILPAQIVAAVAPPSPVGPPTPPVDLGPLDILLAEDNPTNTLVATRVLQKLGHRVTAVVDGQAAIDALASARFDVVLMDVMMPRMDGLAATRAIRDGGQTFADVPIVALTANTLDEDRERAFAAGVDGFATKPVSGERLTAAIAAAIARRAAPGTADGAAIRAA